MPLTFPRIPLVASGQAVTSAQLNIAADAGNARLRSNAGDINRRIFYGFLSLFRQIRKPDETATQWPPEAEFFTMFQGWDPAAHGGWSAAALDDPEGPNLACHMNAFVGGQPAISLNPEDIRLTGTAAERYPGTDGVFLALGALPATTADAWDLGKQQRGVIDLSTGHAGATALDAAQEHYKIVANPLTQHGNSYGGYMPSPKILGGCSDPAYTSYEIKFTPLAGGSPVVFPGTCPGVTGDVAGVADTPLAWIVFIYGDTPQVFLKRDWIQGPYRDGGVVKHQPGELIPRVLNSFCSRFRGTESELAIQTTWLQYAFDVQRFMTAQYFLAPARGTYDSGTHTLTAVYPNGQTDPLGSGVTLIPAGTVIQINGAATYAIGAGYVLGALFAKNHRLVSGSIEIRDVTAGTSLATLALTPDGSGVGDIKTFEQAPATTVQVKAATDLVFSNDTGYVQIELLEQLEYKPQTFDLYLTLRLSSCRTTLSGGVDGSGQTESNANALSDSYFATGAIVNSHGAVSPDSPVDNVNASAAFEEARQMSKYVRVIPRAQFVGYEVTGGKSVCYFKRMATVGTTGVEVDNFEGIAPRRAAMASGEIAEGVVYIVRGSTAVVYNGATVNIGLTFTGVAGVTDFTAFTEGVTPEVYEYEGIRHTALKQGLSNEWLMGEFLKNHNENSDSLWRAEIFSDYWLWSERCHAFHGTYPADFSRFIDYTDSRNSRGWVTGQNFAPEAMTGWRYARGTNKWECSDPLDADCIARRFARYKSCRIYEPEPEVESATILIEGGEEIVRLQFTGRFHHHEAAAASVPRDISLWEDYQTSEASYRTTENGLRDYLLFQYNGTACMQGGLDGGSNVGNQGNSAYLTGDYTDIWSLPDPVKGACFPDFYMIKLLSKGYEDGNAKQDVWDTPLMMDWIRQHDVYLANGCQGFVDGVTSSEVGCLTGVNSVFCYTMPSLCYEAFHLPWLTTLGTATTGRLNAQQVRDDHPQGFGQLQNCSLAAECYNQIAKCWNLLTRVQVMLPSKFQVRYLSGVEDILVDKTFPPGAGGGCNTFCNDTTPGYYSGSAADPGGLIAGGWAETDAAIASMSAAIADGECATDGTGRWILRGRREDVEWRYQLEDPDAINAIPEIWRDLIVDSDGNFKTSARVLASKVTDRSHVVASIHTDPRDTSSCFGGSEIGGGYWACPGGYLWFDQVHDEHTEECVILGANGTVRVAAVGECDFAIGATLGGCCGGGSANQIAFLPVIGQDTAFIEVPLV